MSFYKTYKYSSERWMNDDDRVPGCTAINIDFRMRISEGLKDLGKIAILNYFLLSLSKTDDYLKSQAGNFSTMMRSAAKQRKYFKRLIAQLKDFKVDKKYEKGIDRDIRILEERSHWLFLIVQENIRLTEYYPYFQKYGFDILLDFQTGFDNDPHEQLQVLFEQIKDWNDNHRKKIDAYSKKIEKEKAEIQKYHDEIYAKIQKEKEDAKTKRKEENNLIKEMKKNEKAYRLEQRKIEESLFGRPGKGRTVKYYDR